MSGAGLLLEALELLMALLGMTDLPPAERERLRRRSPWAATGAVAGIGLAFFPLSGVLLAGPEADHSSGIASGLLWKVALWLVVVVGGGLAGLVLGFLAAGIVERRRG